VKGAAAGHTRREADRSATVVTEHGTRAQEADARGESGGDGAERKRLPRRIAHHMRRGDDLINGVESNPVITKNRSKF
jgi:hypothetical protein